ncbi:hypothetical protein [Sphingomonas hylomeconis]|uniref:Collagen-like protein n=1 Tax=Sphingomonas hylomeconis TaxID=1395958 RepID=A0ABV7SQS0_9SPHN|nr:hypothetical protein [Sphingomonas hylomeconis]
MNRRVYAVFDADDDGTVTLRLTLDPPSLGEPSAVLIWRGVLPMANPMNIRLVSDPSKDPSLKGPPGAKGDTGAKGAAGDVGAAGAPGATMLGTVTVTQTAAVALSAGIRSVTLMVPTGLGVKAGDNILLFPTGALPAGYALHNAIATAANTLVVYFTAPLLAIGASFSIPCRVMRIG